jgi:hypothetical protein
LASLCQLNLPHFIFKVLSQLFKKHLTIEGRWKPPKRLFEKVCEKIVEKPGKKLKNAI